MLVGCFSLFLTQLVGKTLKSKKIRQINFSQSSPGNQSFISHEFHGFSVDFDDKTTISMLSLCSL